MPNDDAVKVKFPSGGTSSPAPRLELIPREALVRLASRFQLGIDNRPDGSAWHALSPNFTKPLTDKPFLLNRIGHAIDHLSKLHAILTGQMADDGDDHAGAVGWAFCFLACATAELAKPKKNCSACGGSGSIETRSDCSDRRCPACKGTGSA